MSINIPAETPDESTNPISVEEFERLHPAMLGAIRKAVREEPARTVIGTVGDDRRSHLSSLDLRGIGIEVGRQLSARDMTTEVMGSILERINQAADRLSTEIQELRSELIREHVETVGGGCHGSIHRIESLGEEGKPLAQGSHPLVGIGRFSGLPEHGGYMAGQERMAPEQMALASMRWLQSKVDEQAKQLKSPGRQGPVRQRGRNREDVHPCGRFREDPELFGPHVAYAG